MLEKLRKLIGDYKEIIGAIIGIATTCYVVVDYFATKKEVAVLQCQMLASIQSVDARQSFDTYSNLLSTLIGQLSSTALDQQVRAVLQQRVDETKVKQASAWQDQVAATKQLQPGACEKQVVEKK